jgi:hypothetical protein
VVPTAHHQWFEGKQCQDSRALNSSTRGGELLKVVLIVFMLITMLRILHELRDLKAGDLRGSRRMPREIHYEHTNEEG